MQIKPNEIDTIDTMGKLYNDDVKLIRTTGGYFVAVGRKDRYKKDVAPLAGGSHKALVMHQLEKQFKSDFQASLQKSEHEAQPQVVEFTHKLPQSYINAGYAIYTLNKSIESNIVVTNNGYEVINIEKSYDGLSMISEKPSYNKEMLSVFTKVITEIVNEN